MTVELEPIEGAVFAECPDCDTRLIVGPDSGTPRLVLTHNADGSHTSPAIEVVPMHVVTEEDPQP